MNDYIVRGIAAGGQIRVFAATTRNVVETARQHHEMSPIATVALGRLLTGGAMMGTMMKNDSDVVTIQIKGNGPIGAMTVTADSKGRVKGFVANPQVMLPLKDGKLDIAGNGTAVTFLLEAHKRRLQLLLCPLCRPSRFRPPAFRAGDLLPARIVSTGSAQPI